MTSYTTAIEIVEGNLIGGKYSAEEGLFEYCYRRGQLTPVRKGFVDDDRKYFVIDGQAELGMKYERIRRLRAH